METTDIVFVDKILDNVHGFIQYTEAEDKIMRLLLFKRLQSIKQLSLVNWVFPGSEHTRFVHSLGVMHIADKIAVQLKLSTYQRKIVRLAGLLHDIGHYPLSHVCEFPYKKTIAQYPAESFCEDINYKVYQDIEDFSIKPETEFMKKAKNGHHEEIGTLVIKSNDEIRKIISDECGEDAIEIICDMITGNVERDTDQTALLVQILHSELDADGIDYMLRDAAFSGTSFGSFELDQLIRCMTIGEYNGKQILCITPKGISAADQYLINKFFSYSQIVFNKHTGVLEWMAEQIVAWMQENDAYFPSKKELRETWITKGDESKLTKFIDFTDNFFWSSIKNIIDNPAKKTFPSYIVELCNNLLHHKEIAFINETECKIVSNSDEQISRILRESTLYKNQGKFSDRITILSKREISKHIPVKEFEDKLIPPDDVDPASENDKNSFVEHQKTLRLMDGISVEDKDGIHLLCDDSRSLMQQLWGTHLVVMRSYAFEQK